MLSLKQLSLLIFYTVLCTVATGQQSVLAKNQHSTEAIKAAYVYNFLKYIEWPEESKLEAIRIGFLGNDEKYLDEVIKIQQRSIRKKPVVVHQIKSHTDASQFQAIVVTADQNSRIGNINRALYGTQTLLISDQADDKAKIMLNFIPNGSGSIGFEVNRYNMVHEKLKVSADILVLGGTELDVARLIRDMETELYDSKQELQQQNQKLLSIQKEVNQRTLQLDAQAQELAKLKKEVSEKETQIRRQSFEIKKQSKAIESQKALLNQQQTQFSTTKNELDQLKTELSELDETLKTSKRDIALSSDALKSKQKEISDKEAFIKQLASEIQLKQKQLAQQEQKIFTQEESIAQQQESLESQNITLQSQSSTIQTQGKFLAAAVFGLVLVSFLIIIVLSFYRSAKKANEKLATANEQLEETNNLLLDTQSQLVESEKMAALGGLVAGVAHEINTPLGVSVTAATHLSDAVSNFDKQYQAGHLRRSELEDLLDSARESSAILSRNLERASNLIGNFKQVATDQTVEDLREFELSHYLEELCQSLSPQLKRGHHSINIKAEGQINMNTYPGALAQVITNLVMNSLIHGFEDRSNGKIDISAHLENDILQLIYKDNGVGISDSQRSKIFEPFFTTKRASGGTGLGMHICYNLVTQKLRGSITCEEGFAGARFNIRLPVNITKQ